MAVKDLTNSFPSNTQDGENATENLMIEDPNKDKEDLGEEAQDAEAAAQLQGKDQGDEDVFDDGLP